MDLKLTNFWENFESILNWFQKNDEYYYTLYAYPVAELDEKFYDTLVRLIVDKFRDNEEFNQLFVGYREDFRLELKSLLKDTNFYEQTVDRIKIELIGQKHPATDVIWGTLTNDIVDENVYENATKKLSELYGRNIGNSADWSADAWLVKVVDDSQYVIINDESSDKFEFFKATWNLENEDNDIEVLYTVEYSDIDELIQFVSDYDFTNQIDNDLPEIVNIIFDKDATIAKADGDTIIVATLSNDDELTFYVGNSGNIEFIEENGVDAFDSLMGVYDAEILEFFNQNEDEIMNTFNEMYTDETKVIEDEEEFEDEEESEEEKVIDYLRDNLYNYGVSVFVINERIYNLEKRVPNSTFFRLTCWPQSSIINEIKKSLLNIDLKPISIKRGITGKNTEYHDYFIEIDFNNRGAVNLPKLEKDNLPKIKYTAIDKQTYSSNKSGLEFKIEINGISAIGYWRPISGGYTIDGVDVNELKIGEFKTIKIFSNGGGAKLYEIFGYPKKLEKQPKDLRFTGEYYSTLNLGEVFKEKINDSLNGKIDAKLTKEFLEYFKIIG